ncbi:MAG TPA: ATP-binding protein [Verrucomicrobiae bacterium]
MFDASFRTKVLAPVIVVMALLVAAMVFVVDRQIAQQFHTEAETTLTTADAVFRSLQSKRSEDLRSEFHGLVNQPVYRAFSTAHAPTMRKPLQDLLATEQDVAIVFYATDAQKILASAQRDATISTNAFAAAAEPAVQQALQGNEKVDTVRVDDRLFQIISIPVYDLYNSLVVGALTVGSEIGNTNADQFSGITHSQIILFAGGHAVASTLTNLDADIDLGNLFKESLSADADSPPVVREIPLGGEHYFYIAGKFESLGHDKSIGYVLLSSYEASQHALEKTKQVLLLVSFCAILFGAAVIWFLVNRVTHPLLELRDSAEAVGRGDFSRRVPVRSNDECGKLAVAFNQMTENVQQSRAQLEKTVETLKGTQEQLIQSEKLSAVGEFVAGVAHELNNPLAAVMGFSEILKDTDVGEQPKRYLEMIFKSAQRCQKIVQSLLSFARRHAPERKPVSVNKLVETVLEIVAYPLRTSNIEVVTHFDPKLPVVMADEHQIQQVFLNIVNNARQALEAHQNQSGARIKITTETCQPNVRVIIEDNGPGIPEENLRRIFDPFFTTKEVGKGTGLGLSLCYGMIKEHGGNIKPTSRPGEGATFTIELPIAYDFGGAIETLPAAGAEKIDPREGAGKNVLVIDDEEAILQMVHDGLARSGYRVDTIADGEAALQRLKKQPYDVVFCDWKMPGLNGRQVYERLRESNPGLCRRVIFITGDVINEQMQKFLEVEKRSCLAKPFKLAELRDVIKSVLPAA